MRPFASKSICSFLRLVYSRPFYDAFSSRELHVNESPKKLVGRGTLFRKVEIPSDVDPEVA